jgi:hypothetical protein
MFRKHFLSALHIFTVSLFLILAGQALPASFTQHHTPEEVSALLKSYSAQFPNLAKLLSIGTSYGKRDLSVIRLAAQPKGSADPEARPAVLVSANLEGLHLVGTEAALMIVDKLLLGYGKDKKISALLDTRTIYVAPLLNPDAAQGYFAPIRFEHSRNSRPVDEDLDDAADEDGPDDLNKDGWITQMRVKDPEGKWITDPKEPRLMRLADPKKGEKGMYAVYSEGIDNDGDGEYNEDGPGGVEPNRNFPHDFEYYVKTAGLWPVSEKETISLLDFLVAHPQIALVLNFSTENTLLNLQQTGQARAAADKVKVPRQFAGFLGLDPDTEYTLKEIVDVLNASGVAGGMEITEDMVAMFLGLGPAVQIDRQDMPVIEAVQKDYKAMLKAAQFDYLEKRAKGVGKGSFVAYCYYQYGVPVFSVDLWAIPEPKKEPAKDALSAEILKSMSSEDFLALGEEKIDAFLKEQGAPPNFNAKMLIDMVKSGKVTPARMAEMMEKMPRRASEGEEHPDAYILSWAEATLKGKGFVPWAPYKHPILGDVEIGGLVPYLKTVPPPEEAEKTILAHASFYIDLMTRLAEVRISEAKAEALEKDLYKITAYVTNPGWFPTSTAQGRKAFTAWPITIRLKTEPGQLLFSGRPIESFPFLGGSGETRKLEWTIKAKKGSKITIAVSSPRLGRTEATVVLDK